MAVITLMDGIKMKGKIQSLSIIQWLLYGFNAVVVMLLAAFISITQMKINQSMVARKFLDSVATVPWAIDKMLLYAFISFVLLIFFSILYRRMAGCGSNNKYIILLLEICACIMVMRSINMAYNGMVLIVVADLVSGYKGKNQRIILTVAMLGLYLIASYNLVDFQLKIVALEAYFAYYNQMAQGILKAVCNIFTSFNMIIFVLYIIVLVQDQHQEKERVKMLNEKLNEANRQLRFYAIEVESMAETRERNRLAREIHDTLGHALTGIVAGIDACLATIDAAPEFTKKQLKIIGDVGRHGITDVRRSVKKLRPDALEKFSLQGALQQMIEEFAGTTGMKIKLLCDKWPEKLRKDQEEVIYRLIQESITNANRHGQASNIVIIIEPTADWLKIIIKDDGKGCTKITEGFGLRHMQERLELLKGTFHYEGGNGFTIIASIPVNWGGVYNDKNHDS
ncbi:sensor histidine kinase [Pectinatus brassicae]|uniref:sensor histidine kinase n=1 Tax=Pectinatus brassicae TaxID=862415 RepID=UPI0021A96E7C|nr:sensor histidine kinase [Pectinatus brassicae]